jgi:23S rRNA (uracil1939-C5)-methyltransferase
MYKEAQKMLEITHNTTVVDLYSGIGITSIMFAKNCKEVISIEETESSVSNAKFMAKLNDCKNIIHFCGKCEDQISKIRVSEDVVVFVDPARAGLDEKVINAILDIKPRKIVYMSCEPKTCKRDILLLTNDKNYIVTDILPYNMFPYTRHIETIVCLQRQSGN